jgi:hypothetical protein
MGTVPGKPQGWCQYVLACDSETTGLCFDSDNPAEKGDERHQAISWGFIVADTATLKPVESKYIEVKWNDASIAAREKDPNFGKRAEAIHGLTFDYLEEHGMKEKDAAEEVALLILKYWGPDVAVRLLGHNVATFDLFFLRQMLRNHDLEIKFGARHVDTSGSGFVTFETYTSDQLFDICGYQTRGSHNALADTKMALGSARAMRTIFQVGLKEVYGD